MNYTDIDHISRTQHPKTYDGFIEYGTAGFRTKSDYLDHLLYRMGVLAVLRSKKLGKAIGLMITASHNLEPDNGVKLVDPAGEMLESSWEVIATKLANASETEFVQHLKNIVSEEKINEDAPATVIMGRDTRISGWSLSRAAIDGINATNGTIHDFGIITTPQLHYLVVCMNTDGAYGEPTLTGYFNKYANAFAKTRDSKNNNKYIGEIYLDAANGVGGIAAKRLQDQLDNNLCIKIFNNGTGGLNQNCGADHVKMKQQPPVNNLAKAFQRCVSIDGDADRVVYYYVDDTDRFHLLDGDRIATLVASYLKELVEETGLTIELGLVQTAYANGASTSYISQLLKIPVVFTDTGIKHLHYKAQEFDIGVYFEANGHGTVLFKNSIVDIIRKAARNTRLLHNERMAAKKLDNLIDLINQSVGDALSDMLLVEAILHDRGWDPVAWEKSYQDLPSRQLKIKVQDRKLIKTTDAARKCIAPTGLQEKIDDIVARYSKGRSFVRASGTEDIVRVYAECENFAQVDKLAAEVSLAVYQLANGIGSEPVVPI